MKTFLLLVISATSQFSFAQGWLTNGNSGLTSSNFLGTTDNKTLFFRTNNVDRGKLQANGIWRFGLGGNNASIDTAGVLKFNGTGGYQVGDNKYVFQNTTNPNYGLFFNATTPQYEFKDNLGNALFSINANNGNGALRGSLKIGSYTLPGTDGSSGQVLTTNGTGTVIWANVSGGAGANTSLSNLSATAINQS